MIFNTLPHASAQIHITSYCKWCQVHFLLFHKATGALLKSVLNLTTWHHIDGSVQEIRNSSALAMESRLSCIIPSICGLEGRWFYESYFHYTNWTIHAFSRILLMYLSAANPFILWYGCVTPYEEFVMNYYSIMRFCNGRWDHIP